ncbi:MAG: 4-hydroxythreonine-4-phosphate dehydrogenase PdxA [Nitrospinaceae bacterium]|nr:4-hydroxythreonine-4-phosphate dehydrogenase PdxA [Nitrospinaceae bacterium]
MGDPAGVGPEVCLKAVLTDRVLRVCVPLIVGDLKVLRQHARKMRIPGRMISIKEGEFEELAEMSGKAIPVLDLANVLARDRVFGKIRAGLGRAAVGYIGRAVRLTQEGLVDAVATGPIQKEALRAGGCPFPGHTELLASLVGRGRPVMMLAHGKIRIAHLSTHCPLKEAIRMVKRKRIIYVGRLLAETLGVLDGCPPKIAIAGLNPHAGEGGMFGVEESREIIPAVTELRAEGIDVVGPEPPDTVFAKLRGGLFSGVVAMYHDQGHIAGKMAAFRFSRDGHGSVRGVNVTLGLPLVRTSVEHGTGFEIAGKGLADSASMVDALVLAARMVRGRVGRMPLQRD